MPYYLISLTYNLTDGNTARLDLNNIEAHNQAEAIDKLPAILQSLDNVQGNSILDAIRAGNTNPVPNKIDIKPVPAPPPVNESRFLLQRSQKHRNGWVVTDRENRVVLTFREHHYNDTQHVTFLDNAPHDHLLGARIMREIGDWVAKYHREIL